MIAIVRRCSLRDRQGREVANAGRPFDDRCHHRGPTGVQFPPECGSTTAGAMAVAAREGESIWVRMEHDRTDQDQWKDCREVSREISE